MFKVAQLGPDQNVVLHGGGLPDGSCEVDAQRHPAAEDNVWLVARQGHFAILQKHFMPARYRLLDSWPCFKAY